MLVFVTMVDLKLQLLIATPSFNNHQYYACGYTWMVTGQYKTTEKGPKELQTSGLYQNKDLHISQDAGIFPKITLIINN